MHRPDERNAIFSRMLYKEGTFPYEDYYKRYPAKEEIDRELRNMPNICEEGTLFFDKYMSPLAISIFRYIKGMHPLVDGNPIGKKIDLDAQTMSVKLKETAKYLGTKLVSIAGMKEYHYYSHKARPLKIYGKKLTEKDMLPYGIVIVCPMKKEVIASAPKTAVVVESARVYMEVGVIALALAFYIRELGYNARAHIDGNYLLTPNVVAVDSGLGEFGRLGLLVTKEHGPCVRIAVVTTDMPLIPDKPKEFGLERFCKLCKLCASNCPAKALSFDDDTTTWHSVPEKCYKMWRIFGTDCAVCIKSCPVTYWPSDVIFDTLDNLSEKEIQSIVQSHKERLLSMRDDTFSDFVL